MPTQEATAKNSKFEMVLHSAMELPGIKINRESFLRKELSRYFEDKVIEKAIETNPAQAGISVKNLEQIAKACINYETAKVTAISAVTGIPGGLAMAAFIPADIAQFFGHIVRVLQKLAYLYGWQEIFHCDKEGLDDETSVQLTLFIGVMFGVNAANAVIAKIAKSMAIQAEKTLARKALTQGAIYPIVKKIAKLIGIRMTRGIFAKSVGKIIPLLGAGVSGVITFVGFRPMAKQLQRYLATLPMANVDLYKKPHDNDGNNDIIDIDFSDIVIEDINDFGETDE
ncbi:MAG: EcsC family protein [Oscillospiraceae bacterium]|nr:EcsC family protein [Oscillospiraceae bacterium]